MKKILLLYFIILNSITVVFSQDAGGDKINVGNFVRRVYNSQPFDGIKILQNQNGQDYIVSVVQLKKDESRSKIIESRIASVKAKSFASQLVNGSYISSDLIITETKTKDSIKEKIELTEILKEQSFGFVEGMELLNSFESNDGKYVVYIFYKEIKK